MFVGAEESCPLPADPVLAEVAVAMRDSGEWAWIVDREWRLVYVTDEQRLSLSAGPGMVSLVIGERWSNVMPGVPAELADGPEVKEMMREMFCRIGEFVLDDVAGGKDEVRRMLEPTQEDILDDLAPSTVVSMSAWPFATGTGGEYVAWLRAIRLRDRTGAVRGTALCSSRRPDRSTRRRRRRRLLPGRDLRLGVSGGARLHRGGAPDPRDVDVRRRALRPRRRPAGRALRPALGVDGVHGRHQHRGAGRGHRRGDEVNEAARIEACATGGRILASKPLVERLTVDDAAALAIDAGRVTYTQLSELDTATDKARRDAPAVAVCELH